MSILSAQHVAKNFYTGGSTSQVLKDASVQVDSGELVTILGPSGSGKSTLLNICGLIETPDCGELFHQSKPLHALNEFQRTEFRRRHLGFIFQSFNLIPVMTVADNVAYPLMLLDWKQKEKQQRVKEILEQVGLAEFANKKPESLSGGQLQRVAIARALVKKPSLIIADEPTASLDAKTALRVVELIKHLATEHGTACLIATHDERLLPFSDNVLYIDNGHVVKDARAGIANINTGSHYRSGEVA